MFHKTQGGSMNTERNTYQSQAERALLANFCLRVRGAELLKQISFFK